MVIIRTQEPVKCCSVFELIYKYLLSVAEKIDPSCFFLKRIYLSSETFTFYVFI